MKHVALAALIVFSGATSAFAREAIFEDDTPPEVSQVRESQASVIHRDYLVSAEKSERLNSGSLEFSISSWGPAGFTMPARVDSVTGFRAVGVPAMGLDYISPALVSRAWGEIKVRGGVGFYSMIRSGTIVVDTATRSDYQNAFVVSGRFGVHYEPSVVKVKWLTPFLAAQIEPSMVATNFSFLAPDQSLFGLMGEVSIGTAAHFAKRWDGVITVGETFGAAEGGSRLTGFGISGAIRYSL
ncbi:MAG: hypothetical protein ACXWPM_08950 [Bdellovibrionota bacterium]